MNLLVDSNTLLRTLQPRSPQREIARSAIHRLIGQARELYLAPQNLVELWVVATRPEGENGLGMSVDRAAAELNRFKGLFALLTETSALYPVWESMVIEHRVSGKPAHDARLVAIMRIHGIRSILTFNTSDFVRYPEIDVVHPADVAGLTSSTL